MQPEEQQRLVIAVVEALEQHGLPEGAWLADIDEMRTWAQEIDARLLRLHNAIIRAHAAAQARRDGA